MSSSLVVVALASLATGLLLQPPLIPLLRRWGVTDAPNHRSSHVVVTPRGGGIAVLAALGVGLLAARVEGNGWSVFLGCLVLGGLGLVDDFGGVSARARLAVLISVGGCSSLLLDSPLPVLLAVPAMALWATAYVNAFNFMDGINGISAFSGIVAGAAYAAMGVMFSSTTLVALGSALVGACLSFLPFNLPNARVFLGDVGSYGVGFAIACCSWLAWGAGVPLILALSPTLVYLADTGWTLLRRVRAGAPLLEAHREHTYQRLVAQGRPHWRVAAWVAALAGLVTAVLWVGTVHFDSPLVAVGLVAAMLAAYLVSPEHTSDLRGSP